MSSTVSTMSCAHLDEQIDDYVAWRLSPFVGAAIRAHLLECDTCYRRWKVAEAMAELNLTNVECIDRKPIQSAYDDFKKGRNALNLNATVNEADTSPVSTPPMFSETKERVDEDKNEE